MFWKILFLVVVVPTVIKAELCGYLLTKDCAFVADNVQVCGTNGKTYRNACFLAKAYCLDNSIHKANDGLCAVDTTTTMKPTTTMSSTTVDGGQIALDIFCLDLIYITCPTTGTMVCGSDGRFYTNVCEFDKERCFHRDLVEGTNCT